MLCQLLGDNGPAVLPCWPRVSFRYEEWRLPMVVILALDAELRPRQGIKRFTDAQHVVLADLLPTRRRRVVAAGYLLLVTALASQDFDTGITEGQYARMITVRLLFVMVRLYGRPLVNSVITLVEAITKRRMAASSVRWLVKSPRSVPLAPNFLESRSSSRRDIRELLTGSKRSCQCQKHSLMFPRPAI
jgi:hypothetical protein